MRNTFIFLMLMNFSICFAQSFTLQELENYAQYNFDTFLQKTLGKGYQFFQIIDTQTVFVYPIENNVTNLHFIYYDYDAVRYVTTNKTSYMNLVNSIKNKKYEYFETSQVNDKICSSYSNHNNVIFTCISTFNIDSYSNSTTPNYEVGIIISNR